MTVRPTSQNKRTTPTPQPRRTYAPVLTPEGSAALSAVMTPLRTLYTAGYAAWTPALLQATAQELDAWVVDIRMKPWSKRVEWQKDSLITFLGANYTHEQALGNRNYQGGDIELAAPASAAPRIERLLKTRSVILLCGCKDWQTCHRAVVADYLSDALGGLTVEHLEPPVRVKPTPTAPLPLPALPHGYTVTVSGHVATLALPNGGVCAFDGRTWRKGDGWRGTFVTTDEATAAATARRAAIAAAIVHAGVRGDAGEGGR